MIQIAGSRRALVAVLAAGAVTLTACGSSGGGGGAPSKSQIVSKLKSDSEVNSSLSSSLSGQAASSKNLIYGCIATAMQKDAPADEVRDYVDGKKKIDAIGTKTSQGKLQKDLVACLKNGIAKGSATPSP